MKKRLNENGFTLIELIIVMVILGVIAAIAIPNVISSIDDSRQSADITSGKILADAAGRVLALEGKYSGFTETGLDVSILNGTFTLDGDYSDDFQADLYLALNKFIPVPKYKRTSINEDNFIVVVESGKFIRVFVGSGDDPSINALAIYPNPDTAYTN